MPPDDYDAIRHAIAVFAAVCVIAAVVVVFVQARRSALAEVLHEPAHEYTPPPAAGWCLMPEIPDDSMLVPFRDCPIDELEEAYAAMLSIVAARQHRKATP